MRISIFLTFLTTKYFQSFGLQIKWQEEKSPKPAVDISPREVVPLTEREREVLKLVSQGKNNQEIAEELCVRDVTVKTHLNTVFKKLKVKSRTQATLLAIQMNIL